MAHALQSAPAPERLFERVLEVANALPPEHLPRFLGQLREIEAVAMGRLMAPKVPSPPDEYLSIREAAARLSVSVDYLYHHPNLPFLRREGRRLLASREALDAYMRRKSR